jgi:hypothetical protein
MNRLLMVVIFAVLSGCHSQAPRVRCDSKLQPINAPAPTVKDSAATSATP